MKLVDRQVLGLTVVLQSLDDAIAYRKGRLCLPCQACTAETRCIEHGRDQALVARYEDWHAETFRELLAGMDPEDVARVMPPESDTPPMAAAVGLAVLARLRGEAAGGPVALRIDGVPMVVELGGDVLVESGVQVAADAGPAGCAGETDGLA